MRDFDFYCLDCRQIAERVCGARGAHACPRFNLTAKSGWSRSTPLVSSASRLPLRYRSKKSRHPPSSFHAWCYLHSSLFTQDLLDQGICDPANWLGIDQTRFSAFTARLQRIHAYAGGDTQLNGAKT